MNLRRQNVRWVPMRQAGFSLLEVLLASALASVLLAALWSALSLHLRLFDAGLAEVEQAQLARALLGRIAADLEQAIPPAADAGEKTTVADFVIQPSSSRASSSTKSVEARATIPSENKSSQSTMHTSAVPTSISQRRAGFVGTPESLRIDVVRAMSESVGAGDLAMQTPLERANSYLRTIQYEIAQLPFEGAGPAVNVLAQETEFGSGTAHVGLVRRQLAWSNPASDHARETLGRSSEAHVTPEQLVGGPRGLNQPPARDPGAVGDKAVGENTTFVPEVAELAFRYYDGRAWSNFWDSRALGNLPAAVEITLKFHVATEMDPTAGATADRDSVSDQMQDASAGAELTTGATQVEQHSPGRYRLVVHLPALGRHRESSRRPSGFRDGHLGASGSRRAALPR